MIVQQVCDAVRIVPEIAAQRGRARRHVELLRLAAPEDEELDAPLERELRGS